LGTLENKSHFRQESRVLESLEDRNEACYMVTEIAERIVVEEADAMSKLDYIRRAVTQAHPAILFQDATKFRQFMLDPKLARYFEGAKFAVHDDSYLPVAAENTAKQLAGVMSYVAASSLVFAHAFLESTIEDLLRMSRLCDMNTWVSFVSAKTIPISAILDAAVEAALETKLKDFVEDLHKQSLMFKIEQLAKLLKRSITKSCVKDYMYDASRLQAIDDLRHQLAHHRKKDFTVEAAEQDIRYLYRTAFHFLVLTTERYDLRGQRRADHKLGT